ncbi:FHA domain-containing protein [Amycolatopsis suaedae]|uniref:FHA domain-containing protein n=1 Tax=Amycolatopsis suaedae TaxID=2510978 RepID=A0A4Q7IZZ0_9PSEU|nr:FHA domain-containing protein [Amycolatopsis suaedae]RZQ60089.1 FHA domain-containing protein [Amycolatopsis suaedae]
MTEPEQPDDDVLSAGYGSLAHGVPPSVPGTIYALAINGGITVKPKQGRTLLFGRQREDVHVCVGEDDRKVSRLQGRLICDGGRWWMHNDGRVPIRLPGPRLLFPADEPFPLDEGYTAAFVPGSRDREHLLELFVTGSDVERPHAQPWEVTEPPKVWPLKPDERLALVALAQRYLLQEPRPQPRTWGQVAEQLSQLEPDAEKPWSAKRVEHLVVRVRTRLAKAGVAGLTREEVGEPVGNSLNDNLVRELLLTTSLVPPDLRLLDPPADR